MEIISIRQISERLYQLNENITNELAVHMYLVIGDNKAALIDSGYGLSGDLDQVIAKITDKPVICLLTHSDPDHAGGAAKFDTIYMSEKEKKPLDEGSISPMARLANAKAMCDDAERVAYFKEHMIRAKTFKFNPISDGQIFDLGGVQLQAISFPGHTKGSMCFWNKEDHYCLVGDAVANVHSPVLFFAKCVSLEEYKMNLLEFVNKVGKDCNLYSGHNENKLEKKLLEEIPILCEEIMQGETHNDVPYTPPFLEGASEDATLIEKIKTEAIGFIISKKNLGDAKPMEHKKEGYLATIKYNANKIYKNSQD